VILFRNPALTEMTPSAIRLQRFLGCKRWTKLRSFNKAREHNIYPIELSSLARLILCASTTASTWPQATAWQSDSRDAPLKRSYQPWMVLQFREIILVCATLQVVVLDAI
jgi:hypothetical protein